MGEPALLDFRQEKLHTCDEGDAPRQTPTTRHGAGIPSPCAFLHVLAEAQPASPWPQIVPAQVTVPRSPSRVPPRPTPLQLQLACILHPASNHEALQEAATEAEHRASPRPLSNNARFRPWSLGQRRWAPWPKAASRRPEASPRPSSTVMLRRNSAAWA